MPLYYYNINKTKKRQILRLEVLNVTCHYREENDSVISYLGDF